MTGLMSSGEFRGGRKEPRRKSAHDPRVIMAGQSSSGRPSRAAAARGRVVSTGGGSSDSDSDSQQYRVQHRKRKTTNKRAGSTSTETTQEIEEEVEEEIEQEMDDDAADPPVQPPAQGGIHYGLLKIRRPAVPDYVAKVNYKGKGMTERARQQRRIDPRDQDESCFFDQRFRTMFQCDFYSSVILSREPVVMKSQWIDWDHVRKAKKDSLDHAIAICQRTGLYGLMEFQHDWNSEVIAQFYATLYVQDEPQRMHWMTEGRWYSVDYAVFAGHLGISEEDLERDKIHSEQVLPSEHMGYMYPPQARERGAVVGQVVGLHPTYRYLDRMFRKTIDCKGRDKSKIADYSRNLLHRMRPDAQPFSIFDFLWCEIRSVGERPLKGCGFAPYIMYMIEQVTGHSFDYDKAHKVLKITVDLPEIGIPPAGPGGAAEAAEEEAEAPGEGAPAAGASPPPRAPPRSTSRRGGPPSGLRKFITSIFGICRDTQVKVDRERQARRREREARRRTDQSLRLIAEKLEVQLPVPPESPPSEPEVESETPEQMQARFDRDFSDFFMRQPQEQQQTQEQEQPQDPDTLPIQARLPPHMQPRSSVGEQVAESVWDDFFGGSFDPYFQEGLGDPGQGCSRQPGAPHVDDEEARRDDDDDDE
jgi:hypothetical protein